MNQAHVANESDITIQKAGVIATELGLASKSQSFFENVSLRLPSFGCVSLISEPNPSRTLFLLTLAGRIKPTEGVLEVLGEYRPQRIINLVSVAGISEIDGLEPNVTVETLVNEQLRWNNKFYKFKRVDENAFNQVLNPVFGDDHAINKDTYVGQLSEKNQLLLKIALTEISQKPILVVGSLDQIHNSKERIEVLKTLAELSENRLIITSLTESVEEKFDKYYEFNINLHP